MKNIIFVAYVSPYETELYCYLSERRIFEPENTLDMKRFILIFFVLLSQIFAQAAPKYYSIKGRVTDSQTGEPVAGVIFNIDGTGLWTISDVDGSYVFDRVQPGEYLIKVSCLGYAEAGMNLKLTHNVEDLDFKLSLNTLALDGVVVAAERKKDDMNTTMSLGSHALEHLQMSNITDVSTLLPGGKTVNPDLTTNNTLSLRDGGSAVGNAAFGTALEVDGVRVGNNASFAQPTGSGTRSISVENIESIEVITGVPSAEYGDLNSGMVKIHTRKGRTPWNVTMAVNPRTYQLSASKGFDLGKDRGVLNASGEWTRATKKLTPPYESYTRRGLSLSYSNTFAKVLRFEVGVTGNLGGKNAKDDPDAYSGSWSKGRDNVVRANTSLTWLLNRSWVTNLKIEGSVNYNDNRLHDHSYTTTAATGQPAVHSEKKGYFLATMLPSSYFSDRIVDSRELDFAASFKYEWFRRWGGVKNHVKAGLQWKANGNAGQGEYYEDPALAANGYRPRPYSDYPYLHNLATYLEDNLTVPIGKTSLSLSAGLRMENIFVKGTEYKDVSSLSPRFNIKWKLLDGLSLRGGWGVSEKLPSFYILFPEQQYRDIWTFGVSYGDTAAYVYYTEPYKMEFNPDLKWQRSSNSEIGIDAEFLGVKLSVVGFYNKTINPYRYNNSYSPFSYNVRQLPSGASLSGKTVNGFKVDQTSGDIEIETSDGTIKTETKVTDRTFAENKTPGNGAAVTRAGAELIVDFPEIRPIRTRFRLDANYSYTHYIDRNLYYVYRTGWSHTSLPNRSYQYVGIYSGTSNGTSNGKLSHAADLNLTSTTHIPQARIIITCKLEMSLFSRSRNLSEYDGGEYAHFVEGSGSIYGSNGFTEVYPLKYMDLNGVEHDFTAAEAAKSEFSNLILRSGNAYTFAWDGYGTYLSANLSVTKEIGDHVSLSFFANNFTNSRMSVKSKATGVSAIFTPAFYYGLTCRLKF